MSKTPQAQRGVARTKQPERKQVEMRCLALDQMIESSHRVRLVWAYAESCDLTELYERIRAVQGGVGRKAVDPRLLFALWLFATIEGVSSARRLTLLTTRDMPYQWLCGGVSVNHDLLSTFRAENGALLERLLIHSVGVLLHEQLITLEEVAQDGMRVRANAGSSSFRRDETLDAALIEARAHVEKIKAEHAADPSGEDRRQRAAEQRAATERQTRIERALAELKRLNEQRPSADSEEAGDAVGASADTEPVEESPKGDSAATAALPTAGPPPQADPPPSPSKSPPKKHPPRASTTDPEARRMKMGDGGFRPAFNVQFATDSETRIIIATDVTNQGTDVGLMQPLHAKIQTDYDVTPNRYIVDGGFAKMDDVTALEQAGTAVHAPLPCEKKHLAAGKNPYLPKPRDTAEMATFRQRMGTPAAKEVYKKRGSIAEFPNADCRNRGLTQFRVRGIIKAKSQTLWHVLTFNFIRFIKLDFLDIIMAH